MDVVNAQQVGYVLHIFRVMVPKLQARPVLLRKLEHVL